MTTITLELTDEQAQQWAKEADRSNLTLEQWAQQTLEERVEGRKHQVTQAIKSIIEDNAELYRRLA